MQKTLEYWLRSRPHYLRAAVQRSGARLLRPAEDTLPRICTLDYHVTGYWPSPLVKLDILVTASPSTRSDHCPSRYGVRTRPGAGVEMRELIPRQMFEVAIQAAIGSHIIARETVKALRKNVLAKCYGGDITRKRKLLEKQKEGKKRMKRVGRVEIPQEAFLAVLKMGTEPE